MEAADGFRECLEADTLGCRGGVGTAPGCGGGGLLSCGKVVVRVGDGEGLDEGSADGVARVATAPGRAGE